MSMSSFIEAYDSQGKYWLVYIGLLAVKLFNESALIFARVASWQRRNERQVLQMYCTTSRFHSASMHARLAWGMRHLLDFRLQLLQVEKSSKFKSVKYGGKSAKVQTSAKNFWVILTLWARKHIFHQDASYGPRGPHAVSKALDRRRRWPVRRQKPAIGGRNRRSVA
jgi:hypothetical protein